MSKGDKYYDVIIYGATGYTGILISEYFALKVAVAEPNIKWAVVGRDLDKLLGLNKYLAMKTTNSKFQMKYFHLKEGNQQELVEIFRQGKVLINCVGPFIKLGEPVVEACIKAQTHYTDITGEPKFIRNIEAKFNEEAKKNNIVIVPAAGFDSVPADMCAYLAQKTSQTPLSEVRLYIEQLTGGLSYGTISTFVESISRGQKKNTTATAAPSTKSIQKYSPHRASRVKKWVVPFNFTSDPYIVTLSARQRNQKPFAYSQYLQVEGFFQMLFFMITAFLLFLIVKIPGGAKFILSLQKKGSGPSEEARKKVRTGIQLYASNESKELIQVEYHGPESYTVTAIFASEVALTLVHSASSCKPGVVTTSYGLGELLLERLRKAGSIIRFAVINVKENTPPSD